MRVGKLESESFLHSSRFSATSRREIMQTGLLVSVGVFDIDLKFNSTNTQRLVERVQPNTLSTIRMGEHVEQLMDDFVSNHKHLTIVGKLLFCAYSIREQRFNIPSHEAVIPQKLKRISGSVACHQCNYRIYHNHSHFA